MRKYSVTQVLVDAVLDHTGERPLTAPNLCVWLRIDEQHGRGRCHSPRNDIGPILPCQCGRTDVEILFPPARTRMGA